MTHDTSAGNRQILLTTIQRGKLTAEHFETRDTALPADASIGKRVVRVAA
jgi:hypothetical protein